MKRVPRSVAARAGAVTGTADRKTDWKPTAGWVAVGVGGASLITGVIFGVMVKSKSDEYAEEDKTYGERQEIADDGKRYQKIELATLVVGGVALAAGGGLLLWHYLGGKKSPESSTAYVAPLLSDKVHGIVGGLRF